MPEANADAKSVVNVDLLFTSLPNSLRSPISIHGLIIVPTCPVADPLLHIRSHEAYRPGRISFG